uniref:Uncharacterized protein n=1 Tax=Candidatus Methanogaster sp. ANME-2c ERB4 TaxID=2759911 RepID=A0A7G9Y615_9EURY|nr:hypothetical protein PGOIKPFJ_00001 [Methanosarcinales archaeon ANME-2c ERB4]QNO44140.1 hypothetical protein JFGFLKDL_00001 [Methanosarcinales archaeon ANME-2c ERB4]
MLFVVVNDPNILYRWNIRFLDRFRERIINRGLPTWEHEFHYRRYALIWHIIKPQLLIKYVKNIKQTLFQFLPETTVLFERFVTTRADIPPHLDATDVLFAVCVIAIAAHQHTTFRTRRWNSSAKYPVCSALKIIRELLKTITG